MFIMFYVKLKILKITKWLSKIMFAIVLSKSLLKKIVDSKCQQFCRFSLKNVVGY